MEEKRRGASAVSAAIVIIIGLVGFAAAARRPEFQAMRSVDVVQLLGSGLCFGVGLTLLVFNFKARQPQ